MEEILSSIRRIIAEEEQDLPSGKDDPLAGAFDEAGGDGDDDVLDLTQPVDPPAPETPRGPAEPGFPPQPARADLAAPPFETGAPEAPPNGPRFTRLGEPPAAPDDAFAADQPEFTAETRADDQTGAEQPSADHRADPEAQGQGVDDPAPQVDQAAVAAAAAAAVRAFEPPQPQRPATSQAAAPTGRPSMPASSDQPSPRDVKDDPMPSAKTGLVSDTAASASTGAFAKLTSTLTPEETDTAISDGKTVEALVREMLEPMLKDWLDQNLPEIVERLVEKEISKIARRAEVL